MHEVGFRMGFTSLRTMGLVEGFDFRKELDLAMDLISRDC